MSEKRFSETERNCYYTSLVFDNQTQEQLGTDKVVVLLNELYEENEMLKKRLSLYDEDEVDKYLRTHPMPTTTITSKRKVIPLNMMHKW